MRYNIICATETRREARDFIAALDRETGMGSLLLLARPERGKLQKPYRYIVISAAYIPPNVLHDAQYRVTPPRHPKLQLVREWCYDVLIAAVEGLTGIVRKLKGGRK